MIDSALAKPHVATSAKPPSSNATAAPSYPWLNTLGIKLKAEGGKQKVALVQPKSMAEAAGIAVGDELKDFQLKANELTINMRRDTMRYSTIIDLSGKTPQKPFELQAEESGAAGGVSMRLPRPSLKSGANALVDTTQFQAAQAQAAADKGFALRANKSDSGDPVLDVNDPLHVLAHYQLELIVDQSMSMRTADCPGGLSRWNWCGMQAAELARAIATFVPEGVTITTFNSIFQVYPRSSAQDIITLFNNPQFHGGTRLAGPLANRLNSFFQRRGPNTKPLLIVVLTDGVPVPQEEPGMVINELVEASNRMSNPSEISVVFFQIGAKDRFGHEYLEYLDQGLFRDGARFHLVHTIPFEQLVQMGLAHTLVQTLQRYGTSY